MLLYQLQRLSQPTAQQALHHHHLFQVTPLKSVQTVTRLFSHNPNLVACLFILNFLFHSLPSVPLWVQLHHQFLNRLRSEESWLIVSIQINLLDLSVVTVKRVIVWNCIVNVSSPAGTVIKNVVVLIAITITNMKKREKRQFKQC